jgi:membrane protease YdiL (CAAX protease family)
MTPSNVPQPDTMDDPLAAQLRGFGPPGLLAIVIILAASALSMALGAILVLLWAQLSRTPWREIGYVWPKSWTGTIILGVASGVVFKLAMKAIVMPLLGADPINHTYHGLVGNTAALPGTILTMLVVAGFGEETMLRGFLFERLGKLIGRSVWARVVIVVFTSGLFALAHLPDQGLAGAEQAMFTGLAFGTAFAVSGRIAGVMVAHAAFDLAAVAIIYWDLELKVAHLVFK